MGSSYIRLGRQTTQVTLWQLIMAILDPGWSEERLLHVVNKMHSNNEYIFRFKPMKAQSTREMQDSLFF